MVYEAIIKELKLFKRGKVRDIYELDDKLLIVATDRISCFDIVLPTLLPDKGKILTKISLFWFSFLKDIIANHLISYHLKDLPPCLEKYRDFLKDRIMLVKKCQVIPFECVVRGYISGSAWKEYKRRGSVCGQPLSSALRESDKLKEPIFTPATKAVGGHDTNVDFSYMKDRIGRSLAERIREVSMAIYKKAQSYAEKKGIIIADTKFEFGLNSKELLLVDEVLTPDSSRFWPADTYSPPGPQNSFDKQFVRDYLGQLNWDKNYPAPSLPEEVVEKTLDRYKQALYSLSGVTL